MKKFLFILSIIAPCFLQAQFGIKAGVNFANVSKASSINASSRTGFHAGVYLAPPSKGIFGFRTELLFSKQGYNYKTASNTGNVNLNYILMPQLMCINITKYFQLQIGAQMAFLLNAKVDSSNGSGGSTSSKIMDLYNRFDYGYAAGAEVHPVKGLILGARYNVSLGKLYKDLASSYGNPNYAPSFDLKNNVVQIFVGWTFGNTSGNTPKTPQQ